MTPPRRPVVVVGVGGVGAATLYHLARQGVPALGIERFGVPHQRGSSHGESRILRLAYFEHPSYVPLARRALELWRDLERVSGERLFTTTGSLDGGPENGPLFTGSLASCREHDLDHEVLDGRELATRFPGFLLPARYRFVLQPDGGSLRPERCTESHVRMAEALGASVWQGRAVVGLESDGGGHRLRVRDAEGGEGEIHAEVVVLTPGAWAGRLVPELAGALRVERQVVGWYAPTVPERFAPESFPVFNVEVPEGHYYGFPALEDRGPKIGRFGHRGGSVDPDADPVEVDDGDRGILDRFAGTYLAGAGELDATETCLFTMTPDKDFVVGVSADAPRRVVGAGFSGHGFKFASALGEALAALALDRPPPLPLGLFALDRPALRSEA